MTPSRIEYQDGNRRAIVTHYGRPKVWVVECQTWAYPAHPVKPWRVALDQTSQQPTRRAAEHAAQAWVKWRDDDPDRRAGAGAGS